MSFFGIVDTFSSGTFTGWSYNSSVIKQTLTVKINDLKVREIEANILRPDVKAAGVAPEQCGFAFQLNIQDLPADGCILSLVDSTSGIQLENGIFTLLDGILTPGFPDNTAEVIRPSLSIKQYLKAQEDKFGDQTTALVAKDLLKAIEHLPINTFVALSYLLVLGRIPDPVGFQNSLSNGRFEGNAKFQFVLEMMRSEEFKKKRTPTLVLADLQGCNFSRLS
ncbi:hypothetical protein [Pseudomonas rhizosphaerae]|jgi:hypothetical protein|uniref:hypothetical protein n=1 Tax=Pseudomonas rhizosphaerae TaxID=216142 RepID=UPI002B47A657|nr:hypothetical protein [Pseudomonas rhizosphaerae]MEB2869658.1 hypothetical protein [Pseudomonas rhizosphaerae]